MSSPAGTPSNGVERRCPVRAPVVMTVSTGTPAATSARVTRPWLSRSQCEETRLAAFETCGAGRAGARPYRRKPASRPLSQSGNSASFRLVVCLTSILEAVNRPELRFLDLLVPWIFIVSLLGFLGAWLVMAIMEHTGLSRHVWHLPLFFVALVVLFTSLIGFIFLP